MTAKTGPLTIAAAAERAGIAEAELSAAIASAAAEAERPTARS